MSLTSLDGKPLKHMISSPDSTLNDVCQAIVDGVRKQFPIENARYRIEVSDITIDRKTFDKEDEKKAILESKSLTFPVRGTLRIIDKQTGKTVDEEKNYALADCFHLTDKHTVVYKGNNYVISHLLQLKEGVYHRRRSNGAVMAQINSGGGSLEVSLDPRKQTLILSSGDINVPLVWVLSHVFGIDRQKASAYIPTAIWDKDLMESGDSDGIANRLYRKVAPYEQRKANPDPAQAEKIKWIKVGLEKRTLDEDGTKVTLGKSFGHLDGDALLRIAANIIAIHKGEREEDNRDSLQFKRVVSYPDLIARRFEQGREHENVSDASRKIKWGLDRAVLSKETPKIRKVVVSKPYNKVMQNFLTKSTLSIVPSETNPIESLENVAKVTVLGEGEGGIDLQKANNVRTRNIDPSHLTILDPSRTPEADTVGVDLRFAINSARDAKGNLYGRFKDTKGRSVYLSASQIMNACIGFTIGKKNGLVQAQDHGVLKNVPESKVQYWVEKPTDMYTVTTNLVPFMNADHPGRLTMAGKAIVQALSLKDREAPLVTTATRDRNGREVPFTKVYGKIMTTISPVSGTVSKITDTGMEIRGDDGKTAKVARVVNLPYNQKGFRDDEAPLVKVGDRVEKGQSLYDSNYTRGGELALGRNLNVAFMPYHGFNHEDGIVVSQGAAEKLSSHHAYKYDLSLTTDMKTDRALFRKTFPSLLKSDQLAKLDSRGFIQKGQTLRYGDPIWAVLKPRTMSTTDLMYHRISKQLVSPYLAVVEYWTHEEPGEVIEAHTDGKEVRILTRSVKHLEVGDKLTGFHGNKGVVSKIVPDEQMPYNQETGKPVDAIFNPASVTSRINLGSVLETAAGRIAQKTGKQYVVHNYENAGDSVRKIKDELKAHGLKQHDVLVDPVSGKVLPKVFGGPHYVVKTYKTTDSNYSARNVEGGYDSWRQPSKGGEEGSKRTAYMEFLALLGSNARKNLQEMSTIKAEKNEEFWKAFQNGEPLPKPKTTFATDKFLGYLKGAGIDVRTANDKVTLAPLTDHKILEMSGGEVNEGRLLARTLQPEKGGMFDPIITGGPEGTKWSHYTLAEPIVNPTFEMPVKSVLKLSADEFDRLTDGSYGVQKIAPGHYGLYDTLNQSKVRDIHIGKTGVGMTKKADADEAYNDDKIKVGGEAFKELLANIDVDEALKTSVHNAVNLKSVSARDDEVKRAKYLRGLQKSGFSNPADAYVIKHMPVLPPVMRPFMDQGGGSLHFADVNNLYNDHILVSKTLKKNLADSTPDALVPMRKDLYQGAAAIMGLGDNIGAKKPLKGFIKQIAGEGGPKTGVFHDRLLARKQNFSGRATIYAAPDVGFNEARIPVDQLWVLYKYHILRFLAKQGMSMPEALDSYTKRDNLATYAFNRCIKDIPLLLNRAPTLLRTNELAIYPVPTKENTIGLNPLHLPAFGADFDGDAMTMHLPMTPEAIAEAKAKLLPMHHINDVRKGYGYSMFAPGHEAILGSVHLTSKDETQKTVHFATEAEAVAALKAGKVHENQEVVIGSHHKQASGESVSHNHAEGDPKSAPYILPPSEFYPQGVEDFLSKTTFEYQSQAGMSAPADVSNGVRPLG